MPPQHAPDIWSLTDLCTPWCVHVAVTLRVAEHLAGGTSQIAGLAAVSGGWEAVRSVVDVGGGTGALLAAIVRARPMVRGTLVDLPRTVARAGEVFRAAGVAERVTVSAQSFFDPLPPGADLYLLKSVL